MQLSMMLSTQRTYNESSTMVISIKGAFVESLNARKAMQVGMVNPFQLNSMETQGFPSAKPTVPFCSKGPAV